MSDERDPQSEQRDRTDQPLPGSVSDQNAEEAEPAHGGGEHARRKGAHGGEAGRTESGGEAGEGSQSTGHPDSAG
jgi:hypothetical protein